VTTTPSRKSSKRVSIRSQFIIKAMYGL